MKIILINPPTTSEFEKHWAGFPILGLAYIASSIRKFGHEVILLDGKLDNLNSEQILETIIDCKPDLIGITCMTVEFPTIVKLSTMIKKSINIPIIVGGAHINSIEEKAMEECEYIDFLSIGEGEYLIGELLNQLGGERDYSDIKGLVYRVNNKEFIKNLPRPYPKDYDLLPFPAWDLFNTGEQIPILTHRGCPFHCTFCSHNSGFKTRFRTPENVIAEIKNTIDNYNPKVIRFEDETFGLDIKRTTTIINGILDQGLHKKVSFSAQTRVDRISEEFIILMKKANFETLEMGVESGNEEILLKIKKQITLEQVRTAVALAKKHKLKVWTKFILGHPEETKETIRDTINFITELNPEQLSVAIMTPYPGTPIYELAAKGEGGYKLLVDDWSNYDKYSSGVLELKDVSITQLKIYQLLAYANLYLKNYRFMDAFHLVKNHFSMAVFMVMSIPSSFFSSIFHSKEPKR